MDIAHLASFYEVVLRGGFSAAADALGGEQGDAEPPRPGALESSLNAQLLQRTTRRLSLTEAGKTLYQQAGDLAALAPPGGAGHPGPDRGGQRPAGVHLPRSARGACMVSERSPALPSSVPVSQVELNPTNATSTT